MTDYERILRLERLEKCRSVKVVERATYAASYRKRVNNNNKKKSILPSLYL